MTKLKEKPVENTLPNSVAKHLRVLFVEDSEDDMLLELVELQQAGYIVDSVRVQDATALKNALQDSWDLVISDYNMPSFTGMDALNIIQAHELDVPFILVSGVIGEIAAVNLMKAGAHDYILKDRMTRLVPAIQRELKEASIRQQHRKTEADLAQSELRHRTLLETAADAVVVIDNQGIIDSVNPATETMLGYSKEELIGQNINMLMPEPHQSTHTAYIHRYAKNHVPRIMGNLREIEALHKDGSIIPVDISVTEMEIQGQILFTGIIRDISERKQTQARLLASLAEKDIVLRELHHRVKNNMQVISSLLSLQARYAKINNPQEALQESRQRIRAMAMIHERLYGSDDLALVDFLDYLRYLADRLSRIYHEIGSDIKIQVSGEPLQLPIDHALPSALISNELITNTIKHAYSSGQAERLLEIRIANVSASQAQIIFRDYGRGIDPTILNTEPKTLGLVIVNALTRQLGGIMKLESLNGMVATLTFPLPQINSEHLK